MERSMDSVDLSLVPIERLVQETESRCDTFICGYHLPGDYNGIYVRKAKGMFADRYSLVGVIGSKIMDEMR